MRAKVHIESGRSGRHLLCITEVPYQVNKAQMLEKILKLSEDKKEALGVIHDIRDESDRTGMRAVIELKREADPEQILSYLYKYSDLQVTFGVNMVPLRSENLRNCRCRRLSITISSTSVMWLPAARNMSWIRRWRVRTS